MCTSLPLSLSASLVLKLMYEYLSCTLLGDSRLVREDTMYYRMWESRYWPGSAFQHFQEKLEEDERRREQREQDGEFWTYHKEQVMFMGGMQESSRFVA